MSVTDPIANLASSLSNAAAVGNTEVLIPASSLKERIVKLLNQESIVESYEKINDGGFEFIKIKINPRYKNYKRISKPGRRMYVKASNLPKKQRRITILSTPKGLLNVADAYKQHIGGEILLEVW